MFIISFFVGVVVGVAGHWFVTRFYSSLAIYKKNIEEKIDKSLRESSK